VCDSCDVKLILKVPLHLSLTPPYFFSLLRLIQSAEIILTLAYLT
jgi:hypothetical protein